MKTLNFLLIGIVIVSSAVTASAQKIKLESGNLDFLKGQTALNVEYKYDDMNVGKDKEADYIDKKVSEYNNKEAGKGDKWRKAWFNDRKDKFQPRFELLINKYVNDKGLTITPDNKKAQYTLVIKTTMTEPGFNVGVMRRPAFINVEAIFVHTNKPSEEIAKISLTKSPGNAAAGFDYDTGLRIQEAYAKCGKSLGKYLVGKVL